MSNREVTFGLVHGSWHGAWCWEPLQAALESQGYKSVAMDLPIDEPEANFNDYANVVVHSLRNESELVIVGHSRAGNVIPRAADRLATRMLIFLCSSFEPATIGRPFEAERKLVPVRNNARFQEGIVPIERGLTQFDKEIAKELFFADCSKETQEWAASQLRPQRRTNDEPELNSWPSNSQQYILCDEDLVVNPQWSYYAARNWLGLEPIEFRSGHSPFLSKPRELAKLLISLAEEQI